MTRKQLKARILRALATTVYQDTHDLGAGYLFDDLPEVGSARAFVDRKRTVKSLGKEIEDELRRRADRLWPADDAPQKERAS